MPRELKSINIEVGQRIKSRRESLRLSRDELAKLSGYSSNFIQEVERGRSGLSSESIRAFSTALDISADAILFGKAGQTSDHLARKLSEVPDSKRSLVEQILDAAVACTK